MEDYWFTDLDYHEGCRWSAVSSSACATSIDLPQLGAVVIPAGASESSIGMTVVVPTDNETEEDETIVFEARRRSWVTPAVLTISGDTSTPTAG